MTTKRIQNEAVQNVAKLVAAMVLLMLIIAAGAGTAALILAVNAPWIGVIMIPVFAIVMLALVVAADGI
jgi:hypothetical protein